MIGIYTHLKGIFPALLTPFTKENRINEKALQKLIRINIDKGINGFYVGGSTAEAFLLSIDERKYLFDIVAQETRGKCAVICHVGDISTDAAIELAKKAEDVGADAISAVSPFYYNFTFEEIKNYYLDIVNNTELPMIIYNIPAFSKVTMGIDNILSFAEDKRVIGVKHTSSDFYSMERIKNASERLLIYNGYDEMFLAGLSMGADGGIGSTYNVMAEKFILIKKLFEQGDVVKAREVQNEANEVISVFIKIGVLPAEKEILNIMGIDFGTCRKPFKTLCDEERAMLENIAKKHLKTEF